MNNLITFVNVVSVLWLIWFTVSLIYLLNRARQLKKQYGSVLVSVNDTAFVLTFLSVAWLISQAITQG